MLMPNLTPRIENRKTRRAAFTLMEMLVVVAIIVALAAVGGVYLLGYLRSSQESTAKTQMKNLAEQCKVYYMKNNTWPQNLQVLLQPDPKNGNQPYLEDSNKIMDPWGNQYQYSPPAAGKLYPRIFTTNPQTNQVIDNYQTN